jgi:hypothetical protein
VNLKTWDRKTTIKVLTARLKERKIQAPPAKSKKEVYVDLLVQWGKAHPNDPGEVSVSGGSKAQVSKAKDKPNASGNNAGPPAATAGAHGANGANRADKM